MPTKLTQADVERIAKFHSTLNEQYYNTDRSYEKIHQVMLELESYLAKCDFNPSVATESDSQLLCVTAQLRDCYEIGTKSALRLRYLTNFETWINVVLLIYSNFKGVLNDSLEAERMFSLYLLKLLSTNNMTEYYCMIEKIPSAILETSTLIKIPRDLHTNLASLNFGHVYRILDDMKDDADFYDFVEPIIVLTRSKQAATIACTCSNVSVSYLTELFRFSSDEHTEALIRTQKGWLMDDSSRMVTFGNVLRPTRKSVTFSIDSDLPQRACSHLNVPFELCSACYTEDVAERRSIVLSMNVPKGYPTTTVEAIKDYGNFITLFDSLL